MSRVITITSGKGGVGKTTISLNLALYLSSQGNKTCLFDADLGLANINILLGLHPEQTLKEVLLDGLNINDIIIRDVEGVDILPGSSGVEEIANLSPEKLEQLSRSFSQLSEYDFLVFDTSAGISRDVISFCLSSPEVVVIITPEPTSLTDAYSLVKVLHLNKFEGMVSVVVNLCKDLSAAKPAYTKFKGAVNKYLGIEIRPLGVVVQDPKVVEAVKEQRPFFLTHPDCPASLCLRKIGQRLIEDGAGELEIAEMPSFWNRCLKIFQKPLNLTGSKKRKEPERDPTLAVREESPPSVKDTQDSSETPKEQELEKREAIPRAADTGVRDNGTLLKELVQGISSVSEELRLIRESLMASGVLKGQTAVGTGLGGQVPKIRLDIEAFLKQRQGGGED